VTAKRPVRRARKSRKVARRKPRAPTGYLLRLFVSGASPRSARAIANIKAICERHADGVYLLEVVDIYQQPELARTAQLVAAPTLLKTAPPPVRRLVGDLSDHARVLAGLGLTGKES
jgi:circadian clock protein KaiB